MVAVAAVVVAVVVAALARMSHLAPVQMGEGSQHEKQGGRRGRRANKRTMGGERGKQDIVEGGRTNGVMLGTK